MARKLTPSSSSRITIACPELPKTLFALHKGIEATASLQVRLPDDYTENRSFPLFVYIHGDHGGDGGFFDWTTRIVGHTGWVIVTLPLFKKGLDRRERFQGLKVSFDDYPLIRECYGVMLERVGAVVPNIDRSRSAVCGFSNGAHTLAVLMTNQDPWVSEHFRSVVLVEGGLSLAELHKPYYRQFRIKLLIGTGGTEPHELKHSADRDTRKARLLRDEAQRAGLDFDLVFMQGVGHHFGEQYQSEVGRWLNEA